ncbi:hypothetical protein ACJX0J_041525, partial [Zea mays]
CWTKMLGGGVRTRRGRRSLRRTAEVAQQDDDVQQQVEQQADVDAAQQDDDDAQQDTSGGHGRNPNGILGLLCREHIPGLVEYVGVTRLAYTFDHNAIAPDVVDIDDREFNNKAERLKQELW